jgi:toxin CcdB
MAQFDVHKNIGRNNTAIPYVVVVQSSSFDDYRRRVVVPLVRADLIKPVRYTAFNPQFTIKSARVVLHPLEIVSIPTAQMGPKVGSLAQSSQQIMAALDEMFSRAWQ